MKCQFCGKWSLFDVLECPRCGNDPYKKPDISKKEDESAKPKHLPFSERNNFWPIIKTQETARRAALLGTQATIMLAIFVMVGIIRIKFSADLAEKITIRHLTYINLILFPVAGFLIWRKNSRAASVLALVLYIIQFSFVRHFDFLLTCLMITISMFLINGVRGCFAWHRFEAEKNNEPTPLSQTEEGKI